MALLNEPDVRTATERLFEGFFDDAALFPPGSAPVDRAVAEHLARRGTRPGALSGPLLMTPGHVEAVAAELARVGMPDEPVAIGLVAGIEAWDDVLALVQDPPSGLRVVGLELRPGVGAEHHEQLLALAEAGVGVHLEQSAESFAAAAELVAGTPLRMKFRTGGLEPHLFPSPESLAAVLAAAVRTGVGLKLTAGLHRAVRYVDARTGFSHHGFLNIAVALQRLRADAQADALGALRSDDGAALAAELLAGDAGWRSTFESFGTCSTSEPVETLTDLGLLPTSLTTTGDES